LGLNVEKMNYLIFIDEESLWDNIKDSLFYSFKREVILEDE
jgi:hypothetical protein